MNQILLIDDDEKLAELLDRYLAQFDLKLTNATRPSIGFELLAENKYELIILDVMLPEMDGFDVCKKIRKSSAIPIIMLTARGDVMDRVIGLEIGADDYLPKPFEPRELVARINSILKRSAGDEVGDETIRIENMTLDTVRREFMLDSKRIDLSTSEYALLELFARNAGKTFTRDEILNELKGIDTEIFSRSVDILVSRLRQKLKPHSFIKTIRGSGYLFAGKAP